ncbi:hypothetical protein ACEQ8H_001265 [Pleosporales sp. CAS-2024a]
MRGTHVFALLSALPTAYGVAFGGPVPTDSGPDRALDGMSPVPTKGPSIDELRKRQSSSQATCGWIDGDFSSALTCSIGRTCMLYKSAGLGMAGCCSGSDTRNCGWASACADTNSIIAGNCGNNCLANPLIRKCTNALAPYCVTWTYPSDSLYDFGCDSTSALVVFTVQETASDIFSGSTSIQLRTVTAGAATSPNPTYTYNPSSDGGVSGNGTVKKIAVGVIVGIVIAALAIIFFVGIAVCMCMKRKKKQKQMAANAQLVANVQATRPDSQFPPQMQQAQSPMPPQSPPPANHGHVAPPTSQEQKYNGYTTVHEYNTLTPISNPTTPAPNVPPLPQQQGHYQPPAHGAHEVPSPISQQSTGVYQPPTMTGAHEVPSPPPPPPSVSPVHPYSTPPPAGAHEVDAGSTQHAPSKPVYEMGSQ